MLLTDTLVLIPQSSKGKFISKYITHIIDLVCRVPSSAVLSFPETLDSATTSYSGKNFPVPHHVL